MSDDALPTEGPEAASPQTVTHFPAPAAEAADDACRPPVVGEYELLGELSSGGMGIVYRARQTGLNRVVALKMLLPGLVVTPAARARFKAEAQATAELDHPNIVPIFDVGEHDGRLYFSMKLIEGGALDDLLRRPTRPLDEQLVRLLVKVCRAIHFAHQRGILHRDLKPGNILVDDAGEPYVADFGLVKRIGVEDRVTATGALLGTPAYMAPEQAEGAANAVTTLADVYALGAILYEVLTGVPPFRGRTPLETIRQVLDCPVEPPARVRPGADPKLVAVCLKCLDKAPSRRYASAGELADDLDRWLAGEPVLAHAGGGGARLLAWLRQNRRSAVWVGLIGVCWGLFGPQLPLAVRIYTPLIAQVGDNPLAGLPTPWLVKHARDVPDWLYLWAAIPLATLLHLWVGMLTYLATRSRDRTSHLAGGLIVGLIGGVIAYTQYIGPGFVLVLALTPTAADQALLGEGFATHDPGAVVPHPQDRLLALRPELAAAPEADRGLIFARGVMSQAVSGTFQGITLGMFVTLISALPLGVGGVAIAEASCRRAGSIRAALPLYFEVYTLLSLVLTDIVILAIYLALGWKSRILILGGALLVALGIGFIVLRLTGRWELRDRWRMYGGCLATVGIPFLLAYGGPTHTRFLLVAFAPALALFAYSRLAGRAMKAAPSPQGPGRAAGPHAQTVRPPSTVERTGSTRSD